MNKRFSRREMLKLTATAAAGSLLVACGGEEKEVEVTREVEVTKEVTVKETVIVEATMPPEPTEIPLFGGTVEGKVVVMHHLGEFTEDHVADFEEKNPGITIEMLAEETTRFFAMYAAGSPPDLLRRQAPFIPQALARGLLYDLTAFFDFSDTLNVDDLAPFNNYYRANSPLSIGSGNIYGMCKDASPDNTIWVNTAMFEEAGLPAPSDTEPLTFQEIAELSAQLTTFEGDRTLTFGYAYETGWVDRFVMNMLAELGKSLYTEDFTKIVLLDDEENFAVAKYFYDLAADKLAISSINPSPAGWFGTDFTAGILAMAHYGFWYGAMAESDENRGNVILIPAPTWAGVRRDPTVTATGMIMTAVTKVPEAAWKVFEYYNAGLPSVERAGSGWGVPALKSQYELMPNTTEYEQQKLKVLLAELALDTTPLQFNPFLGETTAADVFNAQLDRALLGEFTFEEMLANVESEVNGAIQDGVNRIL